MHVYAILFKCVYQFLAIVISLVFQFFHEPLVHTVYRLFEGINIHILFCSKGDTIFLFPACLLYTSDAADEL